VVAVLDTDILLPVSVSSSVTVLDVAEDFLFPKKAAGNEDWSSACLGVIVVEEEVVFLLWAGGEVDFVWPNMVDCGVFVIVGDVDDIDDIEYVIFRNRYGLDLID
jgi:hypothetical protein